MVFKMRERERGKEEDRLKQNSVHFLSNLVIHAIFLMFYISFQKECFVLGKVVNTQQICNYSPCRMSKLFYLSDYLGWTSAGLECDQPPQNDKEACNTILGSYEDYCYKTQEGETKKMKMVIFWYNMYLESTSMDSHTEEILYKKN